MFRFTTGDLLKSDAFALVNTVNCEGYMGKGIAYQFKMQYPQMNSEYVKLCKSHKLAPGSLYCYDAKDKLIINFPTKIKWREKSRIEYVSAGLDELINIIKKYDIKSIAIPPLGSGNGGLSWGEVKKLIVNKLDKISESVEIIIYEPSRNYISNPKSEPKLSLSALILMNIKFNLNDDKFTKICLQKTAYFMNILSGKDYFKFTKGNYGPYDYTIEIISKNITEFQKYYNLIDTKEAYQLLMQKLISQNIQEKLDYYIPYIKEAASFTNRLPTCDSVEAVGTALFLIQNNQPINEDEIIMLFKKWSPEKAAKFSVDDIKSAIKYVEEEGIIQKNLMGYMIKNAH